MSDNRTWNLAANVFVIRVGVFIFIRVGVLKNAGHVGESGVNSVLLELLDFLERACVIVLELVKRDSEGFNGAFKPLE